MLKMKKTSDMDEMEKCIALKSMRWGYAFTLVVLGIWMIIANITGGAWQVPFYIVCGQNIVCFFSRQFYRRQVEDDGWKKDIRRFSIVFVILLAVGLFISLFLLGLK
ncbi:hypothetical protein [Acetobacterium wieringae]|uniref:hypothetical protein n=1 Tax=Acetobacterium wieringae TaxID=52694 RepID=UPI0026EBCC3A|nr:hypothetical protein [Acetobacterium wieringae]